MKYPCFLLVRPDPKPPCPSNDATIDSEVRFLWLKEVMSMGGFLFANMEKHDRPVQDRPIQHFTVHIVLC